VVLAGKSYRQTYAQNMAHKLIIKPAARAEIEAALAWYEQQRSGLSIELLDALSEVFDRIIDHPDSFQRRYRDLRMVFTARFPYGVHYTVEGQTIYVHAFMHMKQNPRE